jgi:4-carboxymuconolactone decarboxylase
VSTDDARMGEPTPTDEARWARGAAAMREVYAGVVDPPPAGMMAFSDVMVSQVFAEVWTRPHLDVGQRRLVVMGIIAAVGGADTWKIQVKAAMRRGELTAEAAREVLVQAAQYVGYPRAAELVLATEVAIAEATKEMAERDGGAEPADG